MKSRKAKAIFLAVVLGLLSTILLAGTASAASLFFGPYQPQNWSKDGPGDTSIIPESGPTRSVSFTYHHQPSTYSLETWEFCTTAAKTEEFTFDWRYRGLHCWYMAYAYAYAFADGPSGRQLVPLYEGGVWDYFNFSGSSSIQINEGYSFGFITQGEHFDYSKILEGALTITSPPPGWDEGKKSGWDDSMPPGLDNQDKLPPVVK